MRVPLIDLKIQHHALREEINQALQQVMDRADFALGEDVWHFEKEFSDFCGTRYAVGVDSGLSALELSLRSLGIGPGDEVIVPANTFIATAAAVTFCGAQPLLVDADPITYNIDVAAMEAAITPRTRAVIPVHLYGFPVEMDAMMDLAEEHDLFVVEDACQAHGAIYKGQRVGSWGDTGAFSFYPTKNLGSCGDAGIVVTDDEDVAERIRAMRNCGQRDKYVHELPPFNHRLDTMQAAILRVKLRYLEDWIEARRQNAGLYSELLADTEALTPLESPDSTHVYYVYVIRVPQRDELREYLWQVGGIGTGVHYPVPIHLQPVYAGDRYKQGQFPVTEALCDQVLSLPMFPEMTEEQVAYVVTQIRNYFAQR